MTNDTHIYIGSSCSSLSFHFFSFFLLVAIPTVLMDGYLQDISAALTLATYKIKQHELRFDKICYILTPSLRAMPDYKLGHHL